MPFLPISKQDMKDRGIDQLDFICVTGDAYVDHPSFGIAIISRMLESCGCNVGIIAQPVTDEDFKKLGEPKYCFLVTGGNIDSMVSNYTVWCRIIPNSRKNVGTMHIPRAERAENVPTER